MINLKEFLLESKNNIAEDFIKEINKFISKSINKNTCELFKDNKFNKDENYLKLILKKKPSEFIRETYEIYIYGVDNTDSEYGEEFSWLPDGIENVFFVCCDIETWEGISKSNGSFDYFYEFLQNKNDKEILNLVKPYKGFEKGDLDESFEYYYPINDKLIEYLKEFLLEYCKDPKNN